MTLSRLIVVVAAGCLVGGVALAGPEEDYAAALKSYRDGDVVGALPGLRAAAAQGHSKSQVLLAEILDRSEFDEDAIALYRAAAEQGDTDGMVGYATMLAAGEGIKQKNPGEARAWFEKAGELGHRQAIGVMAQAYMKGELGIGTADQQSPVALRWIQLAAQQDYLPAVDALAQAYSTGGSFGLEVNPRLAAQYQAQADRLRGIEPGRGKKKGRKPAGASEEKR